MRMCCCSICRRSVSWNCGRGFSLCAGSCIPRTQAEACATRIQSGSLSGARLDGHIEDSASTRVEENRRDGNHPASIRQLTLLGENPENLRAQEGQLARG